MSRTFATALAALSLNACFIGYDSRWGARKAAQQHNAARAMPASIAPASSDPPPPASDQLRVRVHATPAYSAQTPDWKAHAASIVTDVSKVLRSDLGVQLTLDAADTWPSGPNDRLDVSLAALRDEDAGENVDLVVGFVGALSMATTDFEKVGLSEVPGKYLVVRAPNMADEFNSLEKAFDELSDADRTLLRRGRVRHREVAVLLHEIGHALGATHQSVAGSLMRPTYDVKMAGFDSASLALMRGTVDRRGQDAGVVQTAALNLPNVLPSVDAGPPIVAKVSAPAGSGQDAVLTELREGDRETWRRALALVEANPSGAWDLARPLFDAYPKAFAVQDLRCKLALTKFGSLDDARADCEPVMKLTSVSGGRDTSEKTHAGKGH